MSNLNGVIYILYFPCGPVECFGEVNEFWNVLLKFVWYKCLWSECLVKLTPIYVEDISGIIALVIGFTCAGLLVLIVSNYKGDC